MMAGIALGGAVGNNIAGTMNGMMGGMNQPTPPPVPTVAYYVAVDGQAAGPYDLKTLQQMILTNSFKKDSLVWKQGMPEWAIAETVQDLKALFDAVPPIPPIK